jgi:hypothetical protein
MTIRSIMELITESNALFPDNNIGDITPAELRQFLKDFLDTVSPAYGAIQMLTESFTLNPTTYTKLAPFDNVIVATAGYFTANVVNGEVTRGLGSVPGSTLLFTINGFVTGSNGNDITVRLFKNGAQTPWVITVNAFGAANPVGFNIAAFDYTDVDATYDIRAIAPNGSYTFSEVSIIAQAQPVRSFV